MTTTASLKNAMNSVANSARHSVQCISTQANALGRSFKSMDLKNTMIETYQNTDMATRKAVLCAAGIAVIAAAALSMQSAPVLPLDPSVDNTTNTSAVSAAGANASASNAFNASLLSAGSNESNISKRQPYVKNNTRGVSSGKGKKINETRVVTQTQENSSQIGAAVLGIMVLSGMTWGVCYLARR